MSNSPESNPGAEPRKDEANAGDEGLTTAALAGHPAKSEPAGEPRSFAQAESSAGEQATPLFSVDEATDLRGRWDAIQTGFVDEPRKAVEKADSLVATAMQRLAEIFAAERSGLETQWDRGDDVSTEDLRVALRRYRSFFTRLLSI